MVFWIDTLCIPVAGGHVSLSPDDVVRLKKDAIRRMTPTYAGAERVLMFDSELTGTPGSAPVEEVLGRLLRSAWIGRCWTFQEMSLAPKLVIRMADGYFDFEQAIYHSLEIMSLKSVQGGRWTPADYISESQQALIDMTEATKPASIHRRRNRDGKTFEDPFRYKRYALKRWAIASDRASYSDMSFMPPALMGQSLQIAQFSYVWNNMNGRSTAMWEDIYSIFANLWGFRVKDIDSLSQNDRMKAMLCALGCIPIRLLFQTMTALTDESPPDRWAPSFPIGDRIDEQGRDVDYAYILGNEGILLQHAGLTTPHGGGVLCVWISSSFSRQTRFSFTLAGYGEGRWWVQLNKATGQYADPETEETNFARCLLLDHEGISKYIPAPAGCAYVSTGAMLSSVQKDGKVITGSLDSSLTFGPWIASEEENTNSEDSPPIKAELLYDIEIRIKTGILFLLFFVVALAFTYTHTDFDDKRYTVAIYTNLPANCQNWLARRCSKSELFSRPDHLAFGSNCHRMRSDRRQPQLLNEDVRNNRDLCPCRGANPVLVDYRGRNLGPDLRLPDVVSKFRRRRCGCRESWRPMVLPLCEILCSLEDR